MVLNKVIVLAFAALVNTESPAVPVYDTIIVGMGAAGTAAASVLCKAGKNVLALEAQNRVGGRVYTVPIGDGIVEVGAEWIHGTHPSLIYDMAMQHNISLFSQGTDLRVYRSDGTDAEKDLINELYNFALVAASETTEKPEALGEHVIKRVTEYITEKHPSLMNNKDFLDHFYYFMGLFSGVYSGCYNWNELTTQSTFQSLDGDQNLSWNKYGYKTFFELLLNTYKGGPGYSTLNLQLEKVVTKITYPQDPTQDVEITCQDGSTYKAKNVIVTVSLGVLKESYETLFSPALPESKITAIKDISMGLVGKIILLFPKQWWGNTSNVDISFIWKKEDIKDFEDDFTFGISGATISMGNKNVMTLWSNGNNTKKIETLPEDEVKRKSMELLRKFMGKNKTIPEPIQMLRSTWFSNPYTRGTYSYDNLKTPQNPEIRATLADPITDSSGTPRVLFAGEATNTIHFSTVHGAAESGAREAHRLVPVVA